MNERTLYLCDLTKCKLFLEKPITLPCCGHSICQKHIQNSTEKKYKCEICSKTVQIPEDGFHMNLKLSFLIDLNRQQRKLTTLNNKQRSLSVGKPIVKPNLTLNKIQNISLNLHHATKRKSSLSSSLSQSTPPQSPISPNPSIKNIKSRIPLPIPPKRKQILSESGLNRKYDLNDSGLMTTPYLRPRREKENIINLSSHEFFAPNYKNLLQSSPKATSKLSSLSDDKNEKIILDIETYRSLIDDLQDTKEILYRLKDMLRFGFSLNDSLVESSLNDSDLNELNKSDFVFEI